MTCESNPHRRAPVSWWPRTACTRKRPRKARPQVDNLEGRQLLSAQIVEIPSQQAVGITGTAQSDVAMVLQVGQNVIVGVKSGTAKPVVKVFSTAAVKQIAFVGGAGDDVFVNLSTIPSAADGGDGHDLLIGGTATDLLRGGNGNDLIIDTFGDNVLYGDDGDDVLITGAGRDKLYGGAGNDRLFAGQGNDELYGEDGNDFLVCDFGDDSAWGGNGHDAINGGPGHDRLYGEAGNDAILGADGDDVIDGGADADVLGGEAGNDRIYGGDGNDVILGGVGDDVLYGQAGLDVLLGEDGIDGLDGGAADDLLDGGLGLDVLLGGDGNDLIFDDLAYVLASSGNDLRATTRFNPSALSTSKSTDPLTVRYQQYNKTFGTSVPLAGNLTYNLNALSGTTPLRITGDIYTWGPNSLLDRRDDNAFLGAAAGSTSYVRKLKDLGLGGIASQVQNSPTLGGYTQTQQRNALLAAGFTPAQLSQFGL